MNRKPPFFKKTYQSSARALRADMRTYWLVKSKLREEEEEEEEEKERRLK